MSPNDAKFRDSAWDKYGIVSVRGKDMGWVATYKVFRDSDKFIKANWC